MIKGIIFCTKNILAIGAHASVSSLIIITYYTVIINSQNFRLHYHQSVRRFMLTRNCIELRAILEAQSTNIFCELAICFHCWSFASK